MNNIHERIKGYCAGLMWTQSYVVRYQLDTNPLPCNLFLFSTITQNNISLLLANNKESKLKAELKINFLTWYYKARD